MRFERHTILNVKVCIIIVLSELDVGEVFYFKMFSSERDRQRRGGGGGETDRRTLGSAGL